MNTMKPTPPRLVFSGALAAAFVAASTSMFAVELLQNNSFDQGSNHWQVTAAAGGLDLFAVPGQVNLHISGYYGNVINQDLNTSNAANAAVSASLTLTRNSPIAGNTIAAYLVYTDTSGATNRLLLLRPDNLSISNATLVSTNLTLPGNAKRIVRFDVDKEANGNFDLLEASLNVTLALPVNPVVSKWWQILSTNAPGDPVRWKDGYQQIVTVGDTVHIAWVRINDAASPYPEQFCYRRSLDGGRTFEPTIVLEEAISTSPQFWEGVHTTRYLAVDGATVHVVAVANLSGSTGVYYYRSTNGGASFQPRRLLAGVNFDQAAGPGCWVTAGGGKVTIVFPFTWTYYFTDPWPGSILRTAPATLNSQDNGDTFSVKTVLPFVEFMGVSIGDVQQSGDTVAVAWRHPDPLSFQHGSYMRLAVSTNGGANFAYIHDPFGDHEPEFACENMRLAVDGPNIYAAWGALITNLTPELYSLCFVRSTNSGASFDPMINLSTPDQPYTASCGVWAAVAARGSNVYVLSHSGNQVLFRASQDFGATFAPPRDLAAGSATLKPSGWEKPILIIDPLSVDGRAVHVSWCGDLYTRSSDGGQTFHPAIHLGTFWSLPYWHSPPQAAVANEHAFLLTWSASYYQNDTDILLRRHGAPPAPAATSLGLHMEYRWDYPDSPVDQQRCDSLQVPAAPALQFSSACTVEMWVRFSGGPVSSYFLLQDVESGYAPITLQVDGDGSYDRRWFSATVGMENTNTFTLTGSGDGIHDGVWHHVALTYDAAGGESNLCLYVDGQLNAAATAKGLLARANGPIWVGFVGGGYPPFNGDIDDLRFWNRARTAQEIPDNFTGPLVGNEPGLVAYYPLDGTTAEMTGNGRDGVLMSKESFAAGADVPPALRVDAVAGATVTLSWMTFGASYRLQVSGGLETSNWQPASGSAISVNGRWTQTVTGSGSKQFFRLERH